jgi:hypothetical protein
MAVGGVFLYNQSKFEKKREVLPLNNNNYIWKWLNKIVF